MVKDYLQDKGLPTYDSGVNGKKAEEPTVINQTIAPQSSDEKDQTPIDQQDTIKVKNSTPAMSLKRMLELNPYRKLGLYETMPVKYYNGVPGNKFFKITRYYGIKRDANYCEKVDLYNLFHQNNVMENIKFISDYAGEESLIRKLVMPRYGPDTLPGVKMSMRRSWYKKPLFNFPLNATMYFFKRVMVHHYYQPNQQIMCQSQAYNHIPGHGVLTRKDLVVDSIKEYAKTYQNQTQCFKENIYFPIAYRLNHYDECRQFFAEIETEQFQENKKTDPIQYIIKVGFGAHRAAGLALFDQLEENKLRAKYAGGAMCGKLKQSLVAQKYISNPLLLDRGNKFDFRIYMLVASVDPLIVYYHDGFLRVSLSTYDKFSKTKNVHFTNTHLSKKVFAEARQNQGYQGMNEQELRDYQMWMMEDLQDYLLKTKKIKDDKWLENELRPKFQEAYIHLARMAEKSFYKSSSVFELYGLDFVLDENLDIWFIECNASPQLVGTNQKKTQFLSKMLSDMFDIQHAYLKSRMKRVYKFIRDMQTAIKADPEHNADYVQLRKEFDIVNQNRLEPEFEISPDNGFIKIMDKNLQGADAYFGHLQSECINNM